MATIKPKNIDIIIDTTEIKIVVVNPLNKNFKLVNPSTLFGEIINQPNSCFVQEESRIIKSKKNIFFTLKIIKN